MTEDLKNYGSPKYDHVGRYMLIIGIISLITFLLTHVPTTPLTQRIGCRECHAPLIVRFKTGAEYGRFHRNPTVEDRKLAAEMAQRQELVDRYLAQQAQARNR
jgi:hypothetical protein